MTEEGAEEDGRAGIAGESDGRRELGRGERRGRVVSPPPWKGLWV